MVSHTGGDSERRFGPASFAREEAEAGESQVTDVGRMCWAQVSEWPERGCAQSPGSSCSLQAVPLPQARGEGQSARSGCESAQPWHL